MAKKEIVKVIVTGEKSTGILHEGVFVGVGELLELEEPDATSLIKRGRAELYDGTQKGAKKKNDKTTE